MFKITKSDTFTWPVDVSLPVDGGRFEASTFDVTFKRLPAAEIEALSARLIEKPMEATDAVRGLVVGWSGIEDDGGPIPFSQAALDRVLEIQRVAPAVMDAFFRANFGAARKN